MVKTMNECEYIEKCNYEGRLRDQMCYSATKYQCWRFRIFKEKEIADNNLEKIVKKKHPIEGYNI